MAIYIIGDIQGCYSEFSALLESVSFDPDKDEIWPAGDIVARGPDSLSTIRLIKSLGTSAKMVLGNHDLHLLATYAGIKKVKKNDQLNDLLNAPDADEIMNWLSQQPLLRQLPDANAYMSHAGISPQWTKKQAITQARMAQEKISSPERNYWLAKMYGEHPANWLDAKTEIEQFRYTVNSFTRMRFCNNDLSLEFQTKSSPSLAPKTLKPWYELSKVLNKNQWFFGHWASLMGKCSNSNVFALDTGCVWGNELTMLRWPDKVIFTESSHKV